jgi:hypothetical protein
MDFLKHIISKQYILDNLWFLGEVEREKTDCESCHDTVPLNMNKQYKKLLPLHSAGSFVW